MERIRKTETVLKSKPTIEGAGVHLKRAFGHNEVPLLDPFLLLDHFGSENPEDYLAGFPWHPHRGIETVTYMIEGLVEHGDSMGNEGAIGTGDIQWMTAGSGIIHQEMPRRWEIPTAGFQLWINLPASHKMMDPRYRDVKKDQIPEIRPRQNTKVKVICGEFNGTKGPMQDIVVDIEYLDISLEPHTVFNHPSPAGNTTFAYIFDGAGYFDPRRETLVSSEHLVLFQDGDSVRITSADDSLRFLLISGRPIEEPVAWHGPIVMNNQEELDLAFKEYRNGTFIKHR
ncbi:pirin family protein [Thermodesulfobacteriota bacterium]